MLLIFLLSLTLPGISYQGDRIFYHDARSLALGGVSIILENSENPASMALIDRIALNLSGWVVVQNERRGLRVYDSFGNNIGISTLSNNTYTNIFAGPSAVIIPWKMVRVGLQYAPIWDYNYYYYHEHRDDFYQITRIEEQSYDGYVHALSPMLSFTYKFLSIGVQGSFITGTLRSEDKLIIPQIADTIHQEETNFSSNKAKIGLAFFPSLNFRMAYTFQQEYELEEIGFTYPTAHSFAVMYGPPGKIPTKFVAQVDMEMWDENIFSYKFGVEHLILSRYRLRYGFCIFPDYEQPVIWTTNLTVGFGITTEKYVFDIGYSYGKRDYQASDFDLIDVDNDYRFDETTNNLLISTGIYF